jgi:hypothetical protein
MRDCQLIGLCRGVAPLRRERASRKYELLPASNRAKKFLKLYTEKISMVDS